MKLQLKMMWAIERSRTINYRSWKSSKGSPHLPMVTNAVVRLVELPIIVINLIDTPHLATR